MNKGDRKSMSTHLACEPRGKQTERFHSAATANVGKRHSVKVKCDELKRGGREFSEVFNQHKTTILNDLGFNASVRN
jgi:hypothetical protein